MPSLTVVAPYGSAAATTRARALEWAEHLGLEVDLLDYAGTATNGAADLVRHPRATAAGERRARRAQVRGPLLLLREASPFSRGGLEERLLSRATPGVYDLDDALYADVRRLPDPAALFPKPLKADRAARAAHRVVVGNEVLAQWATARCRDVVVVPTCVDPAQYEPRTSYDITGVPVVGWMGSPSTEPFLQLVAEPLLALHRSTGAVLRVVSSGGADLGALEPMAERVAWTSTGWAEALRSFDVGIGPLPDTPFTRGKCAYKLLQYAAAGVPFVASPVGANATAVDRLAGTAAATPEHWTDALHDLVTAPAASRMALGDKGIAGVAQHYSFDAWAPTWRAAVLEV